LILSATGELEWFLDTLKGVLGGREIYDVFKDIPFISPPALDTAATEQKGFHRNVARTLC
jgi:hypothetical protein